VNDELETMCKEVVSVYFEVHLHVGLRITKKNLSGQSMAETGVETGTSRILCRSTNRTQRHLVIRLVLL
jgi:hypothetical protein